MDIKNFLSDKKKILKFTILTVGVLAVMFLLALGITYGTSFPKFCASCHIMKPEFATWEASSHSQVDCVACHVDSGVVNALKHKAVATKELYKYVTKTYELPIHMTETIPDDRCLKCHSLKRKVSPSSTDLYIPHEKHHDNKIACVKCHQGVAHGKIASRGMTLGGDFNSWNRSAGQKVMNRDSIIPKMDLCMDCHGRRGVTVACEACHTSSVKPDSHRQTSFKLNHGKDAKKNIRYCDTCHAYIKAPGVTSKDLPEAEDPVAKYLNSFQTGSDSDYTEYARTNEFCIDCHRKRPVTHTETWPFEHGKSVKNNEQRCLVCHSPRSDVKGTTTQGAC
ncbi:MAG TPA: NapC/NirT family cytochrome c, partial [Desulfobacteria bacterium]|nr:NapC/NirT family cytochrome c [Desulfobacteria bacterium]